MAIFEKKNPIFSQIVIPPTKSLSYFSRFCSSLSLSISFYQWKLQCRVSIRHVYPAIFEQRSKEIVYMYIYIIFSTYFKSFFTRKTFIERKNRKIRRKNNRCSNAANPLQLAIHYLRRNTYALNFPLLSFPLLSFFFTRALRFFDRILSKWTGTGNFSNFPTTSCATSKVAHTYNTLVANESIEIALDCVTGESGREYIS